MSLKGKARGQVTAGYKRLYGDDATRAIDACRDRNVINGHLGCRVEQDGTLNAAEREKVEICVGKVGAPKRDSGLSGEVAGWYTVRGKRAIDAHD